MCRALIGAGSATGSTLSLLVKYVSFKVFVWNLIRFWTVFTLDLILGWRTSSRRT